ncbi:MAG: DUF2325 domain-containing protein [Rhizobiales bacterium]|jgi:hypothetical protein|nr:DUF2325 domain-containing protein [Hyphomicrobiales bacterium]
MSSLSGHLRSSLYGLPLEARTPPAVAELAALAANRPQTAPIQKPQSLKPKTVSRRSRIWELNSHLHCSIIGTCLSAAELRRLLVRLKVAGIETADEHELHMLGVLLANRPEEGAKLLQKTLDRRHQVTIHQFAKARDDASIAALWRKAITGGDIPGAYWAVLTHPDSSDRLVQKAFGDIHMLSHLMGATNCADLQRMRRLEDENAVLVDKLDRQQKQLHGGFVERDRKIERLTKSLADKIQHDGGSPADHGGDEIMTLRATIADLSRQLASEAGRRERLEQRQKALEEADRARRAAEEERDALRHELETIERGIGSMIPDATAGSMPSLDLNGLAVLYVGGRLSQIPQLRALVEHGGGEFLHHDGGIEHAAALLPGLVGRADVTVFPVDCVSHNAMTSAKRACQQLNKPYVALRTSSLTCLLSSLTSRANTAMMETA